MLDTVEEKKIKDVLVTYPDKIVLSNMKDHMYGYKKTVISKILLKGELVYQIEKFTQKQVFHENIKPEQVTEVVFALFPDTYGQMNVFHEDRQWDYRITKKGKLLSNSHRVDGGGCSVYPAMKNPKGEKSIVIEGTPLPTNNRKKNYLLEEGCVIPPLIDLGILTGDGKVVRNMYDKYRQINRFLELVWDVVKDYPNKDMHIVDFGCGKSYLTFVLYYFLVEVKGYHVHITGLDLKENVIHHCNETAKKYGYENLHFELGDINGYHTDEAVDMVVTLHACDTATDYALYNAICWKAGIILSVPCCQKEINGQINSESLSLLTKYGIVKERVSALITDVIRANALEYCGYKTQVLEFVDYASSPKNILIRAVRNNISQGKKARAKEEIISLMKEFQITQTLVDLLQI